MKKTLLFLLFLILSISNLEAANNQNIFGAVRDSVNDEYARVSNGGLNVNSSNFELNVSMGKISGYSTLDKFGVNNLITSTSDPEDVWEFGGLYNYDADNTAPIQYISSSSALDVGQTISVQGLDIDGYLVEQEVITNGQNNVMLTTALWRVFRLENNSDFGNSLNGVLYAHTDPTPTAGVPASIATRAIINDGNNQTLMSLYTIPRGKVGFLYRGEFGMEFTGSVGTGTQFAKLRYYSRRFGKEFKIKKEISCINVANSVYQDSRSFPDIIPAMTDIRLTVQEVSDDMGVWGTFDILLVDESEFTTEYLQAIGQIGY